METLSSFMFSRRLLAFKSYYVVWKQGSVDTMVKALESLNRTM